MFHQMSKHQILLGFYIDFGCLDSLVEQMCKSVSVNEASSLSIQVMKPLLHSELYKCLFKVELQVWESILQ